MGNDCRCEADNCSVVLFSEANQAPKVGIGECSVISKVEEDKSKGPGPKKVLGRSGRLVTGARKNHGQMREIDSTRRKVRGEKDAVPRRNPRRRLFVLLKLMDYGCNNGKTGPVTEYFREGAAKYGQGA